MKKTVCLLLTICLLFSAAPLTLSLAAAPALIASGKFGADGDNLRWTLHADGAFTVSGKGEMDGDLYESPWSEYGNDIKTVTIENGVTSVGSYAFAWLPSLTEVSLPETLLSINSRAFYFCENLRQIRLPANLQTIREEAFGGCGITEVVIPDSVTNLADYAFSYCKIKKLTIGNGVTEISAYTFYSCPVTDVFIGKNVQKIDAYSFHSAPIETIRVHNDNPFFKVESGCLIEKAKNRIVRTAMNFEFPADVDTIGSYAFSSVPLRNGSIVVPDTITVIEDEAFAFCKQLLEITLPKNVTSFGKSVFLGCTSLVHAVLPENLTTLDQTFDDCNSLLYITLPNGVTEIGERAFIFCNQLVWIYIPASVKTIRADAFWSNFDLLHVFYEGSKQDWEKIDNEADPESSFNDRFFDAEIHYDIKDPETIILSEGVCGDNLSYVLDCKGNMTISGTGKMYDYIENTPWFDLNAVIRNVTVEEGAESIGFNAFNGSAARTVSLPESIRQIKTYGFSFCENLKEIQIPAQCTEIQDEAFLGCGRLEKIEVAEGNPVYYVENNCLIEKETKRLIRGCADSVIPEDVTALGCGAFSYCEFSSVYIPAKVSSIEYEAFKFCGKLSQIEIPDGVERLTEHMLAFTGVKRILIPRSVTEIEEGALYCSCNPETGEHVDGYSLTDIYYEGSEEEWNNIKINKENHRIISFTIVVGEDPSDESGIDDDPFSLKNANEAIDSAEIHYNSQFITAADGSKHVAGEAFSVAVAAPSCTEPGESRIITPCAVCGRTIEEQSVTVPSDGHKWDAGTIVSPATCAKQGEKEYVCTVCGETKREEIPKTDVHTYGNWTVIRRATADQEGLKTHVCAVCGAKEEQVIPKTNVQFKPGDVDGDGEITAADARLALRRSVTLENYTEGTREYLACDADADGSVTAADARMILRASVGLEKTSDWV
ncbi:MAG: leucine-rich repeat protein [Clostridia bacterium]|nr:leucine-rich repeat protein [Clostridia bacterium]